MIKIFNADASDFLGLGLGTLLPSSCIVKEELNGLYELELNHPYDDLDKWMRLEENRIIIANTPTGNQPFRIYRLTPSMSEIQVNARHIFYDLLENNISIISITDTAKNILNAFLSSFNYQTPFTFDTDIDVTGRVYCENVNPIKALLGNEEGLISFADTFACELRRDGYSIKLLQTVGTHTGITIRYAKNLVGLEVDEDYSDVKTRIIATIKPESYAPVITYTLDSEHINNYPFPKIFSYHSSSNTFNDLKKEVNELMESGIDIPKVNIKVEFTPLSKTEEYKNYAKLEEIFLGDLVTIINPKMNFKKQARVISYEWDSLLEQYVNVELGDFLPVLTNSVSNSLNATYRVDAVSSEVKQVLGLLNSVITITDECMYVSVDSPNYLESTRLFKFGVDGLQFSNTGFFGIWTTLINNNGVISS